MNYLMCSVGRRGELIKNFKKSIPVGSKIIAVDCSKYAPALYVADKQYIVPRIDDEGYIDVLLDICSREKIRAVTTFIDPEIELLAKNRSRFETQQVEVLAPYEDTARLCFDKYEMFKYLTKCGISTMMTWDTIEAFTKMLKVKKATFPVFVKPRRGSSSEGAQKIDDYQLLKEVIAHDSSLSIQEYMSGIDLNADVYIDTISHKAVSAFCKRKIETRIGGASKTISFIDQALFMYIDKIVSMLEFHGPIDMDLFYRDGQYYLSEINPRFGGSYLHAYGAGVDFIKLIENNLNGIENKPNFGQYNEGVVMMMYDSAIIRESDELVIGK